MGPTTETTENRRARQTQPAYKVAAAHRQRRYAKRPQTKQRHKLRARIRALLHQNTRHEIGGPRSSLLVGCTAHELCWYIKSLFQPGMTWENHGWGPGKWHTDHIIPLAAFDLDDPVQVRAANHFTNLQPLWHVDHVRKGATLPR